MSIITKTEELNALCTRLAAEPFITVDTEFLREKTYYPKLCLIQIGDKDKNAVAIDPMAEEIDLSSLFELLQNPAVLKIFHAGRQDIEIFYNMTGKVVAPFFDTQIAAMVCGHGASAGYEALVRSVTGAQVDKSAQFTDWSLRPLSQGQIEYALGDVTHLVDVYLSLVKELEKRGRTSWVFQEEEILNDPGTYKIDPYECWRRIKIRSPKPKALAVLRELAAWRELKAQEKDIPRPWVLRDEALAEIATQAPTNTEKLGRIRGISADQAASNRGKEIIDAVKRALDSPKKDWPVPERKKPLPSSSAATVDILKMLLKIQSATHEVAPKLIASSEDIEAIALYDAPKIPAMQGWRFEVFGRDALALKKGHLAITLKDSMIVKLDLTPRD